MAAEKMTPRKVLLMESVADQAASARSALVGAGHRLVISRFEIDGLKKLKEWQPEVVIVSSSYSKDPLAAFCRKLRSAAEGPLRIVVASPLSVAKLFEEEPDLREAADGVVSRPYSAVRIREAMEKLFAPRGGPAAEAPPAANPAGARVLLVEGDPELTKALADHLAPAGVSVDAVHWEAAAELCRSNRPGAVIMEWPVPEGFSIDTLREIQEAPGEPEIPVILLSRSSLEVVKARSPGLVNRMDMIFTKPVSWAPFLRYLQRVLKSSQPPKAVEEKAPPAPPAAAAVEGGGVAHEHFQRQLEEKFLEVEELRRRLREAEERQAGAAEAEDELARLREENVALQTKAEEVLKQVRVDEAKMKFRETELEVKLSNLIRRKTEAERSAQDLIDAETERAEEMERALAEAHGELQLLGEQTQAYRSDLEKAAAERDRALEEKKQAEVELGKMRFREAELDVRLNRLLVGKSAAERRAQDLLDAAQEREGEMGRALSEAHSEINKVAKKAEALALELERERRERGGEKEARLALETGLRRLEEERGLQAAAAEKEREGARELREKLEEALQERAEAVERCDDLAARAQSLADERDGLKRALLEKSEETKRHVARLEALQAKAGEHGDARDRLEEALAAKDRALAELGERLHASEMAVAGLDEEISGWRDRMVEKDKLVAALHSRESELTQELEGMLSAERSQAGVGGAELERLRAEKEAEARGELTRLEALLSESRAERELAEARSTERESEVRRLLDQISALEGHEEQLRRMVDDGQKARRDLEEELGRLRESIAGDGGELSARVAELEGLLAQREGSSAGLQERLAAAEAESARIAGEVGELRAELETAGMKLTEREREIGRLLDQTGLFEEREENLRRRIAGEEKARRDLEEELGRLRESAAGDAGGLAAKAAGLESLLAERAESTAKLLGRLEAAEAESARLSDSLAEGAGAREEARAALVEREREAAELRARIALLLEERDTLAKRAEAGERGRGDLEGELRAARSKIEELGEAVTAAESRTAGQSALVAEQRQNALSLEEELQSLRTTLERERELRAGLESRVSELTLEVERTGREDREADRVRAVLEEVMARAQGEVIERTKKEVELQEKLRTSLEEKKFLLTRLERELTEASGRERRLTDLLEKALQGATEVAASASGGRAHEKDNLPAVVVEGRRESKRILWPAAFFALLVLGTLAWLVSRQGPRATGDHAATSAAPAASAQAPVDLSSQRRDWEQWTRSDVSGGVLFQATLRTRDELAVEVEAEKKSRGLSDEEAREELERLLQPYRFEENFYFYLYMKNLQPGYPTYADDIHTRLVLRDDKGNETQAIIPPDLAKNRRIYSFASGGLAQGRSELTYEVSLPVAFSRGSLVSRPAYLELLAFNVGASSRRVLTWELE